MLKLKYSLFITLIFSETALATSEFPLQMLNLTNKDVTITLEKDIGNVYFDEPLEEDTLLPAGHYSHTYGVIFAPRDSNSRFKLIFKGEQYCVFTVSYFKFPEPPPVLITGENCYQAGYRVERSGNYDILVLYVN